jgi:transposase-like protein
MPSKYDVETKERVVRLFLERREQAPTESLTGIPVDTMRGWVTKAQVDAGERPGTSTAERDELRRLKRENAELRRANEILKTASAFFAAAELDRQRR